MTVVYIDLLFLLNLTANYLLLLAAGRIAGAVLARVRIGLGAALGALYAVAVFLPGLGWLAAWPCRVGAGVLMVLAAYGGERGLFRVVVVFFCGAAALGGGVLALELLGSGPLTLERGVFYTRADVRLLLLAFVGSYFVLSLFFRRGARAAGGLVRLEIDLDGGRAELTSLVDTGNSLTDPATNKPVVVAYAGALAGVLPDWADASAPVEAVKRAFDAGARGARLVPYRAVGVECGVLLAVRARSVKADGKPLGGLLIALSPTAVDDGGGYQALIGGI